jgi:two-component system, NarL family, response regulator LiaR
MDKISVLIVDDHAVVRQGLRSLLGLQEEIEVVGEAANGLEAVEQTSRLLPDVVLMDLIMPQVDGIEATRRIRALSPSTQVIVLTSFGEDEKVFSAIKAGALSYLLKNVPLPTGQGGPVRLPRRDPAPPGNRQEADGRAFPWPQEADRRRTHRAGIGRASAHCPGPEQPGDSQRVNN